MQDARRDGKLVLKAAVADVVPRWVIQSPKQGFGAPVQTWFGSYFGQLMRELLTTDTVRTYLTRKRLDVRSTRRGAATGIRSTSGRS